MDNFIWTDDLNLGIDIIDSQHKQIVAYINELNGAIRNKRSEDVYTVLESVRDYTFNHFTFEEQLLERAGYVLLDAHQAVHRRFEEKVRKVQEDLADGRDPFVVARKVRTWLMTWLIQHIKHEDIDYVPMVKKFLRKKERTSWIGGAIKSIFG